MIIFDAGANLRTLAVLLTGECNSPRVYLPAPRGDPAFGSAPCSRPAPSLPDITGAPGSAGARPVPPWDQPLLQGDQGEPRGGGQVPALHLLPCGFQWPLFRSCGDLESPLKVPPSVSAWSGGVCCRVGGPSLGLAEGLGENEAGHGRW